MSRAQRLLVVLLLNLALVAGLATAGVTAHSLAVLAAGGDYLLDAAGVGLALVALRISAGATGEDRRTKASNVAALVNSGWLLILEVLVAIAAADRLLNGAPEVHGLPVMIVSAVAALVMGVGAVVLHGDGDDDDDEHDASVAAVLLDTLADAAAAAGVAVTGAIIMVAGGWYWLDPAVALVIAIVIAYHALALVRKVLAWLRPSPADGAG